MNRRVLVVAFHAPPSPAIGGLRWWGFSKYLARRGWEMTILTAASGEQAAPPGVRMERVAPVATLGDRYREWRMSRAAPILTVQSDAAGHVVTPRPRGLVAMVRTELSESLSFPDPARGWITRAIVRGRALVRELGPAIIVSTGPPHSMHVIARALGAGPRTKLLLDYRDPWKDHQPTSPLGARLLSWTEDRLVDGAHGLIATTPELTEMLRTRFPAAIVDWIPNGVDTEALPRRRTPPPGAPLDVVHVGSLYGNRDPGPIIAAFQRFLADAASGEGAGARLRFIGDLEQPYLGILERLRDGGTAPYLSLEPPVRREAALDTLSGAHLALVLATKQPNLVPAKLYEAVGMGVPTLVITEPGSATATAAERVGATHRAPEDTAGIAAAIAAARAGRLEARAGGGMPVTHAELAVETERVLRRHLDRT